MSVATIAQTVGVSRGSVKNCLKRLEAGAISCKKRSRRPRKTCDRNDRFLEETAKRIKSPFDITPAETRVRGEHGTSYFQIFSLPSTCGERNARPSPSQEAGRRPKNVVSGQWFRDNDVTVLDCPPCLPDADPIENLWRILKVVATAGHSREEWAALQATLRRFL